MNKYKILIDKSTVKKTKDILFERIAKTPNFKYNLNESYFRGLYKKKLNESTSDGLFINISNHFLEHNKLSGNLSEDVKFLKEFTILLRENDDFDPFAHLQKKDMIDIKNDCLLNISKDGNSKLNHPYISLPAGYTCPFADVCKSFASKDGSEFASSGKKIKDHGDIRCYAANAELQYKIVRESRWQNFDLIKEFKGDVDGIANLIEKSIKYHVPNSTIFRIHESGDFFSQEYFDAWVQVAKNMPNVLFYAYTKALPYWTARLNAIPNNMKLTASRGGKYDELIDKYDLKQAVIVKNPEEAATLKLPIDVDDRLAYASDNDFALLLHGTQSKESGLTSQAIANSKLLKQFKSK